MRGPAAIPLCLALLIPYGCSRSDDADGGRSAAPAGSPRVSIMTFNVENLFDARHDSGKRDRTYLPLSAKGTAAHRAGCAKLKREFWREECLHLDWSEGVLKLKLERIAGAVLQTGGGKGPDILVLQEVENRGVLERLRTEHLGPAGYGPAVHLEGSDSRGIDQAVLTRLPVVGGPRLRKVPLRRGFAREILQAEVRLPDGGTLTVFAVHLPNPAAPRALREACLRRLNGLLGELPSGAAAVAAGDFNISSEEDAAYRLFETLAEPRWLVSHRIGCAKCPGTAYYAPRSEWSFMDAILLSGGLGPNGSSDWMVVKDSIALANDAAEQKNRYGRPSRFDPQFSRGVSDHWPLVLELALRSPGRGTR